MAAVTGDNWGVYVRFYKRRYGYYGYCCRRDRRCCCGRDAGAAASVVYGVLLQERYRRNEERGPLERGAGALLYEEELNTKLISYHEICECAGNFP